MKTSVEIDQELFEAVRGILATGTLNETIDEAFRENRQGEVRGAWRK